MKQFGLLIALVALVLGLYNAWQLSQIKDQMRALRAKSATVAKAAQPDEPGVQELLARAQNHSAKAKQLMAKGDSKAARAEMQKSLEALRKAEGIASAQTNGLRDTFESARKKLEGALSYFGSESNPKPAKGDSAQ